MANKVQKPNFYLKKEELLALHQRVRRVTAFQVYQRYCNRKYGIPLHGKDPFEAVNALWNGLDDYGKGIFYYQAEKQYKAKVREQKKLRQASGYPKMTRNSFTFFVKEKRMEEPWKKWSARNGLMQALAKEWKGLSVAEKEKFVGLQKADSERWFTEIADFKKKYGC